MAEYAVDEVFEPRGRLSSLLPGYKYRRAQHESARAIERAVKDAKHIMAQVPTGGGKSLAGLIPPLMAKNKGDRIVVCTGSNALSEQYYYKDLPIIAKALHDIPFSYNYAKGKGNFACLRSVDEMVAHPWFEFEIQQSQINDLVSWIAQTSTGDKSDITFPLDDRLWSEIACAESCMNRGCRYYANGCFFQENRRACRKSTVVVTNHVLYLLDRTLGGKLIGDHEVVIVDEAHMFAECAQNTLGFTIYDHTIAEFAKRMHDQLKRADMWPAEYVYRTISADIRSAERKFWSAFDAVDTGQTRLIKMSEDTLKAAAKCADKLCREMDVIDAVLDRVQSMPTYSSDLSDMVNGMERKRDELEKCLRFAFKNEDNWCSYLDQYDKGGERKHSLSAKPINPAPLLSGLIFKPPSDAERPVRSAILMSATLAAGKLANGEANFEFQRSEMGVNKPVTITVDSPFDLRKQAYLYLPSTVPDPRTTTQANYLSKVAIEVTRILEKTNGRGLVLCTSFKVMNHIAEHLTRALEHRVLVQGELGDQMLIDQFKADTHSVLVGVNRMWTGIDVPGEALSAVIIVSMPFSVPSDPIVESKSEILEAKGMHPFVHYMLPQAIIKLLQGAGRLVRTETDKGLLAILDSRIHDKQWGRQVKGALSELRRIDSLSELRL